jgi:hypothetical protein
MYTKRTKECIIILLPSSFFHDLFFSFEPSNTSSSTTTDKNLSCCVLASWQISLGSILSFFFLLSRLNDHSFPLCLSLSLFFFHHTHARRKDRHSEKKKKKKKSSLNEIRRSNNDKHYICFFSSSFSLKHIMTPRKSSYPFIAQAETLLIYGIFLFLTGLAQICVTISHRYVIERTIHNNHNINILNLLPVKLTLTDIHLWYIYPSAALVSLIYQNVKCDDS